jgi:hypothetical protein
MDPDALTEELFELFNQLRSADNAVTILDQVIDKAKELQAWLRLGGIAPWLAD